LNNKTRSSTVIANLGERVNEQVPSAVTYLTDTHIEMAVLE